MPYFIDKCQERFIFRIVPWVAQAFSSLTLHRKHLSVNLCSTYCKARESEEKTENVNVAWSFQCGRDVCSLIYFISISLSTDQYKSL